MHPYLHPDYLSTRYVMERSEREGLPAVGVQHHHAHICACMAEHGLLGDRPVIGVSFDGTGYGDDGAIWGGEFLLADFSGYKRLAHLRYVPLPGGDKAIREPWRQSLAWLQAAGQVWEEDLPPVRAALRGGSATESSRGYGKHLLSLQHQLHTGINAPNTSSMGRLFDAVSALVGVREVVNYEAQAAIELEALAEASENYAYPFEVRRIVTDPVLHDFANPWIIDPAPVIQEIVSDLRAGIDVGRISARFHSGVAQMVLDTLLAMRSLTGVSDIALSGGVWQNLLLFRNTVHLLSENGFNLLIHHQVPANDGGIALGQAICAASKLISGFQPAARDKFRVRKNERFVLKEL